MKSQSSNVEPIRKTRRSIIKAGSALAGASLAAPLIGRFSSALAAYPDRPIKMLVPFAPGGPIDVIARLIAPPLGEALGNASIVIENRGGASGNIGMGMAARAEPDGYTVLMTSSTLVVNPLMFNSVPYDPIADFMPLVDIASYPNAFTAAPALGVATLGELVALAKKEAGKLNYSSAGFGTLSHLCGEYLKSKAGIDVVHVPFPGAGGATQGLLSGSIHFLSFTLPGVHPHIQAGTMKGLATTGETRWFDLPDMPTMLESGYSDFVVGGFTAMLVPAKTPPEIGERLAKETLVILQRPAVKALLRKVGAEATAGGPQVLKARISREMPLWRGIVQQAGIRPQEAK